MVSRLFISLALILLGNGAANAYEELICSKEGYCVKKQFITGFPKDYNPNAKLPESPHARKVLSAFNQAAITIAPLVDSYRIKEADKTARDNAKEVLKETGAKYGLAVILVNQPLTALDLDAEYGYAKSIKARQYEHAPVYANDDLQSLYKQLFGPVTSRAELNAADTNPSRSTPAFFHKAILVERKDDGTFNERVITNEDQLAYVDDQLKRKADIESERAKKAAEKASEIEKQRNEAEKLEGEKRAEEEARIAKEEAKRKAEEKDAQEKRVAYERTKRERDELIKERNKACSSGDGTECVKANDRLMQWTDEAQNKINTAMCADPEYLEATGKRCIADNNRREGFPSPYAINNGRAWETRTVNRAEVLKEIIGRDANNTHSEQEFQNRYINIMRNRINKGMLIGMPIK